MNLSRKTMAPWVIEALEGLGGQGTIFEICKAVWERHGAEIQAAGDIFFKWQYEIRWAADALRKEGAIAPSTESKRGTWALAK